jgi:hypothetical protein
VLNFVQNYRIIFKMKQWVNYFMHKPLCYWSQLLRKLRTQSPYNELYGKSLFCFLLFYSAVLRAVQVQGQGCYASLSLPVVIHQCDKAYVSYLYCN